MPPVIQEAGKAYLVDESGQPYAFDIADAPDALASGHVPATAAQYAKIKRSEELESGGYQALSALAGAARGATFGLSDVALTKSGLVDPRTLRQMREANPGLSTAGEFGGMAASAIIPGGPMARLAGVGAKAGLGATNLAARTLAQSVTQFAPKMAGGLTREAVIGAGLGAGKAVSDIVIDEMNPEESVQHALAEMAGGAALGAGLGAAVTAGSTLAKKAWAKSNIGFAEVQAIGKEAKAVRANIEEMVAASAPEESLIPEIRRLRALSARHETLQNKSYARVASRAIAFAVGGALGGGIQGGVLGLMLAPIIMRDFENALVPAVAGIKRLSVRAIEGIARTETGRDVIDAMVGGARNLEAAGGIARREAEAAAVAGKEINALGQTIAPKGEGNILDQVVGTGNWRDPRYVRRPFNAAAEDLQKTGAQVGESGRRLGRVAGQVEGIAGGFAEGVEDILSKRGTILEWQERGLGKKITEWGPKDFEAARDMVRTGVTPTPKLAQKTIDEVTGIARKKAAEAGLVGDEAQRVVDLALQEAEAQGKSIGGSFVQKIIDRMNETWVESAAGRAVSKAKSEPFVKAALEAAPGLADRAGELITIEAGTGAMAGEAAGRMAFGAALGASKEASPFFLAKGMFWGYLTDGVPGALSVYAGYKGGAIYKRFGDVIASKIIPGSEALVRSVIDKRQWRLLADEAQDASPDGVEAHVLASTPADWPPAVAGAAAQRARAVIETIQQTAPRTQETAIPSGGKPSAGLDKLEHDRVVESIINPDSFVKAMKDGTLTPEMVAAFDRVYPEATAEMRARASAAIASAKATEAQYSPKQTKMLSVLLKRSGAAPRMYQPKGVATFQAMHAAHKKPGPKPRGGNLNLSNAAMTQTQQLMAAKR